MTFCLNKKWAFCWETFITISVVGQKIRHYFVMSQRIFGKPRTVEAAIEPHPSIVAQSLNMFLLSLFTAFRANAFDPVLRKDKHPIITPLLVKSLHFCIRLKGPYVWIQVLSQIVWFEVSGLSLEAWISGTSTYPTNPNPRV